MHQLKQPVQIPHSQYKPLFVRMYFGTPEGIRTPDLLVRSQTLYPAELPAHFAVPFVDCLYIISCHDQEVKKFFLVFLKILRRDFENDWLIQKKPPINTRSRFV